eukprot:5698514-Prymnesium_polylepis.1
MAGSRSGGASGRGHRTRSAPTCCATTRSRRPATSRGSPLAAASLRAPQSPLCRAAAAAAAACCHGARRPRRCVARWRS